jgi:hypothetical protein
VEEVTEVLKAPRIVVVEVVEARDAAMKKVA